MDVNDAFASAMLVPNAASTMPSLTFPSTVERAYSVLNDRRTIRQVSIIDFKRTPVCIRHIHNLQYSVECLCSSPKADIRTQGGETADLAKKRRKETTSVPDSVCRKAPIRFFCPVSGTSPPSPYRTIDVVHAPERDVPLLYRSATVSGSNGIPCGWGVLREA